MASGILSDSPETSSEVVPSSDSHLKVPEDMTYREFLIKHGISTSREPELKVRRDLIKMKKLQDLERPILDHIFNEGTPRKVVLNEALSQEHLEFVSKIQEILYGE